jgi:hypothetical protein
VEWIHLAQASCCECGDEPSGSGDMELVPSTVPKFWFGYETCANQSGAVTICVLLDPQGE